MNLRVVIALVGWLAVSSAISGGADLPASSTQTAEKSLRFAAKWSSDTKPAFAPFNAWAMTYLQTSGVKARKALIAQGVALAETRRNALVALIESDPKEALASAVPISIRNQLPGEITALLEQRISGIGDFEVVAVVPAAGYPIRNLVQRTVTINGVTYQAFVYGRRKYQETKYQLPVSGIALDGKIALHESPLRLLDPGEALKSGTKIVAWHGAHKPMTQTTSPASGDSVVQSGDQYIAVPTATPIATVESAMIAQESAPGPNLVSASFATAASPPTWTIGNKSVLVIRVDFSDIPGGDASSATIQNVMDNQVSPWYLQTSYNQTSQTTTVSSKLYRMPQTGAYYAVNNANDQLMTDAKALAAADFTVANYDRVIVDFPNLGNLPNSQITYGGLGDVGGPRVWVNGYYVSSILEHELGHTYGLWHAHLWQVSDGDPISPNGSPIEYGDPFDQMGSGSNGQFNAWYKYRLLWLTDANVTTVTTNGTYRVTRQDGSDGSAVCALKIKRDASINYWVSLRKLMPTNESSNSLMPHDAYITWGYNDAEGSNLIDTQTPGSNPNDAGLPIGATFSDPGAGLSIKTVDEGGAPGSEYLDIAVSFNSYPVTVASSPGNGGLETGAGTFPVNSSQTVTATPNQGYTFVNWTENGNVVSTSPTYTFSLSVPRNLIANFVALSPVNWQTTGSMAATRVDHSATLLSNGQVLVAGGSNESFLTKTAELYNPSSGLWTSTASLLNYFYRHSAVLLPNGQVLVSYGSFTATMAELYNPGTAQWSNTGTIIGNLGSQTTTLLPNGQVLVAGGYNSSFVSQSTAVLYDTSTGTWSSTGSLNVSRYGHTATLLPNGKVLVAGGYNTTGSGFQTSAELYDSATGTWTLTGSMSNSRYEHTATLLNTGKVLIAGGTGNSGLQSSAELYDPATGIWSAAASLNVGRDLHTANLLPDGEVLVAGGSDGSGNSLNSSELYFPPNNTWTLGPTLNVARSGHRSVTLANGAVLVVGGQDSSSTALSSAEIYTPYFKQAQTITFAALPNKLTTSPAFALSATASSGLPVQFTLVSGPATLSNGTVTITGAGIVTIRADQPGDANYLAAPSVTQSFAVGGTFSQWQTTYGITDLSATPWNDGVPNLLKYLYDIDPSRPMTSADRAALPAFATGTGGALTITFREQSVASGVTLHVQTSSDLKTWTSLPLSQTASPTAYTLQQLRLDPTTNDPIMQVSVQPSGAARQFLRLNVTQP